MVPYVGRHQCIQLISILHFFNLFMAKEPNIKAQIYTRGGTQAEEWDGLAKICNSCIVKIKLKLIHGFSILHANLHWCKIIVGRHKMRIYTSNILHKINPKWLILNKILKCKMYFYISTFFYHDSTVNQARSYIIKSHQDCHT